MLSVITPSHYKRQDFIMMYKCAKVHFKRENHKCFLKLTHPIFLLSVLDTHHGVISVLLGETAHQTHQLLVFLTVKFQLLSVSAAAWDWSRSLLWHPNIWKAGFTPALLQPVTVALHDVGNNTVWPVALPGVHLPALRTRACASLPMASGTRPVTLNAPLAEGVITRQRHRLLEKIQTDGASQISADSVC